MQYSIPKSREILFFWFPPNKEPSYILTKDQGPNFRPPHFELGSYGYNTTWQDWYVRVEQESNGALSNSHWKPIKLEDVPAEVKAYILLMGY